jgi:hypothetical protein
MLNPDGTIKPPSEMSSDDRIQDAMRHFPKLLSRWNGGYARFWNYSVSHCLFSIRIASPGVMGNLEIRCSAGYISGPVAWRPALIEITYENGVGYLIVDKAAGVRIVAATVSIAENVKPVDVGFEAKTIEVTPDCH